MMERIGKDLAEALELIKSFCEAHMKDVDDYGNKKLCCNCPYIRVDKKFGIRCCGLTTGFDAKDWCCYPVIPKKWEVEG